MKKYVVRPIIGLLIGLVFSTVASAFIVLGITAVAAFGQGGFSMFPVVEAFCWVIVVFSVGCAVFSKQVISFLIGSL